MANIFEQYGIKEVADVMIYKLEEKDGVTTEKPWLYLDTLKVSTLEQTAEQAEARGGKGNSPLIIWDFGKEINITLEDALYSPRSMATTWGGEGGWTDTSEVTRTVAVVATGSTAPEVKYINPKTGNEVTATEVSYKKEDGSTITENFESGKTYFATYKLSVNGSKLTIGADDYPGIFKIVGDTYARNRNTGEDEFFQFIIHRAKMSAENTLTLEAEGDPTVFNLNLRTLRPKDGNMIELIQYQLTDATQAPTETDDQARAKAELVIGLIGEIADADADDKDAAIYAARAAYDNLSTKAQSYVTNYSVLEEAEDKPLSGS